jgi:hypothetical protein
VGSPGGVAGFNGQTNLAQLRCGMNTVWPALPHPVLGIIDSDAAHHVSLLLAERALRQAVDDCLTALDVAGVIFAGFDICGLPTYAGGSVVGGGLAAVARVALACNDIVRFEGQIAALL